MANSIPTQNIIFHNYPEMEVPDAIKRALATVILANENRRRFPRPWEIIFRDGDHTRYENTVIISSQLKDLTADYEGHARSDDELAKGERWEECQLIYHDVEDKDVRASLLEAHELGFSLGRNIRVTFMKGDRSRADFTIDLNSPQTIDYLCLAYMAGGSDQLDHMIGDCKQQLKELQGSDDTPKKAGKAEKHVSRKKGSFIESVQNEPASPKKQPSSRKKAEELTATSLGNSTVEERGDQFTLSFNSAGLGKSRLLTKAVESLNLIGKSTLSGAKFTVEEGKLSLPKNPASPWTLALTELMAQQKMRGNVRTQD